MRERHHLWGIVEGNRIHHPSFPAYHQIADLGEGHGLPDCPYPRHPQDPRIVLKTLFKDLAHLIADRYNVYPGLSDRSDRFIQMRPMLMMRRAAQAPEDARP